MFQGQCQLLAQPGWSGAGSLSGRVKQKCNGKPCAESHDHLRRVPCPMAQHGIMWQLKDNFCIAYLKNGWTLAICAAPRHEMGESMAFQSVVREGVRALASTLRTGMVFTGN